jgi:hypothetical protein
MERELRPRDESCREIRHVMQGNGRCGRFCARRAVGVAQHSSFASLGLGGSGVPALLTYALAYRPPRSGNNVTLRKNRKIILRP